MILVVWGFYSMLSGTTEADNTTHLLEHSHESAIGQACPSALNLMIMGSNGPDSTVESVFKRECSNHINWYCIDETQLAESEKAAMTITAPFLILCAIWIINVFYSSGFYKYRYDQVGYHLNFILVRAKFSYKVATLLMFLFTIGVFFYGASEISKGEGDKRGTAIPALMNGVFQTLLGLWGLYAPVEETLEYSEEVMQSKIKSPLYSDSITAVAKWQDAILAAEKGEYSFWEKITNTGPEIFMQVYKGIKPARSAAGGEDIAEVEVTTDK